MFFMVLWISLAMIIIEGGSCFKDFLQFQICDWFYVEKEVFFGFIKTEEGNPLESDSP